MQPAGVCFTDDLLFFLLSPLSLDNMCTDLNVDCSVNTVDDKIPAAENLVNFGQVAFTFVAQRDKLAWNSFTICAGILQWLGRSQNLIPYRDSGWTHYIL